MYLGDTAQWISLFREGGMTMPWGEDYIFQVPVGTQQMNFIMVDMFRAAIKNKPNVHEMLERLMSGQGGDDLRQAVLAKDVDAVEKLTGKKLSIEELHHTAMAYAKYQEDPNAKQVLSTLFGPPGETGPSCFGERKCSGAGRRDR